MPDLTRIGGMNANVEAAVLPPLGAISGVAALCVAAILMQVALWLLVMWAPPHNRPTTAWCNATGRGDFLCQLSSRQNLRLLAAGLVNVVDVLPRSCPIN
jgi:hypothetical protein